MTASSAWDVSRGSRQTTVCDATGEVLAPGSACRSVLVPTPADPEQNQSQDEAQDENQDQNQDEAPKQAREAAPNQARSPVSPFQRVDVSQAAWDAGHRPAGAFSHWRSSVPDPATPRREPLDLPGLVELLNRLAEDTHADHGRAAFRFVLALLLMRRRMLRLDETRTVDGETLWCFTLKENPAKGPMGRWAEGERLEIPDPNLDDADAAAVAKQLHETLGVDA